MGNESAPLSHYSSAGSKEREKKGKLTRSRERCLLFNMALILKFILPERISDRENKSIRKLTDRQG